MLLAALRELLLPRTDAGVLVQVLILAAAVAAGSWHFRGDGDRQRLVIGAGLLLLAGMALRAAH